MMTESRGQGEQVVRISFLWLLLGGVVMALIGMGGGLAANIIWPRPMVPLANNQEQIVTTVQEVTISPNKAAAEVVAKSDRSIVGITLKEANNQSLLANGAVVTNDGLVVTTAKLPQAELVAIDHMGLAVSLGLVGSDKLYGLTYLRIEEGVVGPLDVRKDTVPVGQELLLLSRAKMTFLPQVEKWLLKEWVLPPEISPAGIQRLWRGTVVNDATLTGGALLDDDGRLAGMVMNGPAGLVLGADDLLISMQRLTRGEREADPLSDLGIKAHYSLLSSGQEKRLFVVEVAAVDDGSPAALAGLKVQDVIVSINGQELDWQESVVKRITAEPVREMAVRRGRRAESLTLVFNAKQP